MVEAAWVVCVHVWDILPAAGPTSQGTCRVCGETREFANSSEHLVVSTGRPLDFHPRPAAPIEEVPVADKNVHKRHKEIEKRWPEIKRAIEETGRINRAARQLGISYDGVSRLAIRHGMDTAPYRPKAGAVTNSSASGGKADKGVAPARHVRTPAPAREKTAVGEGGPAGAGNLGDIGQALIGLGLVMIGAWLEERKGR
jgi:hypothetical protein